MINLPNTIQSALNEFELFALIDPPDHNEIYKSFELLRDNIETYFSNIPDLFSDSKQNAIIPLDFTELPDIEINRIRGHISETFNELESTILEQGN